jgi:Mrp family chromosome partitioning ATPase
MERPGKVETLSPTQRHALDKSRMVAIQVTKKVDAESFPFRHEIGALLSRVRIGLAQDSALIVNVTSALPGEGVSTVARELVHAAATMPWCRPLLIDRNPGSNDQGNWFGLKLPDLLAIYDSDRYLSAAAIEVSGTTFHAARISPDVIMDAGPRHAPRRLAGPDGPMRRLELASLPPSDGDDARGRTVRNSSSPGELMRVAYDLVVIDCPPVLSSPPFLLLTQRAAEVLLVVRAERTRLAEVAAAKERLVAAQCEISGVIMNRRRRRVPSLFGGFP